MTMSAAPMARGGMTPGAPGMTVQPMVRTRKKVPMNSAIYLRIGSGVVVGTTMKRDHLCSLGLLKLNWVFVFMVVVASFGFSVLSFLGLIGLVISLSACLVYLI